MTFEIDFKSLLGDITEYEPPNELPEILPPSIRDVNMGSCYEMFLHMQDPCPNCGAFNMLLGDYVCYNMCSPCFEELNKEKTIP